MKTHRIALPCFLLAASATLAAQVPEGWHIISRFWGPGATFQGGLVMFHPRTPDLFQAVSGLPLELTGPGTTQFVGAGCVLYRERDGLLVVGEHAPSGQTLDIHAITLSGGAMASDVRYTIGPLASAPGFVDQMAWLSESRVLFNHWNTTAGPMAGYVLGILDLDTSVITPVLPAGFVPGINALAVSPTGTEYYVGTNSGASGILYRIPAANPTATNVLAVFPRLLLQLSVGADGSIYAGTGASTAYAGSDLFRVDPVTGATTPMHPTIQLVNALTVEPATGHLAFSAIDWPASGLINQFVGPPGGPYQVVGMATNQIGDTPSGCAVNSNMDRYGAATAGANTYTIDTAPNPGGLPIEGNPGFSVTVRSAPASAPGLLGIALQSAAIPVAGVTLHIDPATLLAVIDVPVLPVTIPLGLPPASGLSGLVAYLQGVFFDPAGVAATTGVRVTIL